MQLVGSKSSKRQEEILEGIFEGGNPANLLPTEAEDMWHAYKLIQPKDVVKAPAIRKVVTESKTGSTQSERVHTSLTIEVKSTFFDPVVSQLQVSGQVIEENTYVNLRQQHTLDLELNRSFTLWKASGWDSVAQETLKKSLNPDKDGALAAILMDEGTARVCLITQNQTITMQRLKETISKKMSTNSNHDSDTRRFFSKTLAALTNKIDFSKPRPLLLASPGFVAQNFKEYLKTEGQRRGDEVLKKVASGAMMAHTSTGLDHGLEEAYKDPRVAEQLKDMMFARETKLMDKFYDHLRKDDDRAWYGKVPVQKAVNQGAVGRGGGVLLISDSLFHSKERALYVSLHDKATADGGEVRILSGDHESGKRLNNLTGIVAILTYPFPGLDEYEEGDEGENAGAGEPTDGEMVI